MTNPPVDAPVTTPVKPKAPASPFDSPTKSRFDVASPFDALPRFDLAARFDAAGGAPPRSPFRAPFHPPFDRSPRGKGRRRLEHVRRAVILPTLGGRREPPARRYVVPYERIAEIEQRHNGSFIYLPGMGENFTALAEESVNYQLGCIGELDCDELKDGWCLDVGETHMHPLGVDTAEGEMLLGHSCEYEMRYEDASCNDKHGPMLWYPFTEAFRAGRQQLLADPDQLLDQPGLGGSVAVLVLKAAGYAPDNGLHLASRLEEVLRFHLDGGDPAVQAAFADYGIMEFGSVVEGPAGEAMQLLEQLSNADAWVVHPDEAQFLTFRPEDVDDGEDGGAPAGQMWGEWICVDTTYHSLFDSSEWEGWPYAIGWRECEMRPLNNYRQHTPGGSQLDLFGDT